ncbi:uncharacterized protein PITG_15329 [Phytophthora infestans T30-4]|uniref:HTH La-type RNA-binding domain-containing protein n=1 Tax=Phytophthora infestans (strain T30-4) TaxID=403677 RepID=D0NQG1_PHYIT|nr:uncharacterized protein PITG_15329 [Phytophthora infestans T30-4]EEY62893.1 conserved hypothetical protein [Phytophthora infestans T30-4]|eukprot:XP_002898768.1 conserved hypothetical protein [Phytophthora infestans T30-4]
MNAMEAEAPEGAVKYRLVEAEEVSDKTQTAAASRALKPKRKGKLNWSQFPMEGEDNVVAPEGDNTQVDTVATAAADVRTRGGQQQGRRGPRSGGRFGGRRQQGDSNGTYVNGVYVPTPDLKVTAQWAKNQIEFYFTSDNLVRDIFLRQHMDVDGFVPLAFVGSFQAVYSVHQDYESLLEAMKQSETVELDEQNEKIRLRQGWQMWVWPNAEGGYGVPRYIKLAEDEALADEKTA